MMFYFDFDFPLFIDARISAANRKQSVQLAWSKKNIHNQNACLDS